MLSGGQVYKHVSLNAEEATIINVHLYSTMWNPHVLVLIICCTVSALLAVGFVIVRKNTSLRSAVAASLKAQITSRIFNEGRHQYDVSDLEQRVSQSYSLSNFTDSWYGIANDSFPEVFFSPQGIHDQADTVLIYVQSNPTHFAYRELIRRSWGSRNFYQIIPWEFQLYVIFVLGINIDVVVNPSLLSALVYENGIHHDILLYDFVDGYKNLTSKGFLAMSWIDAHFDNIKYVMKTDDNILLNTYEWLYQIHLMDIERCEVCIACSINKIFERKQYPHCKGRAYIFSIEALRKILSEYKQAVWKMREDVYFTGDLGYQKGVTLRDTLNFSSPAVNNVIVKGLAPAVDEAIHWDRNWLARFKQYQRLYANM